MVSKIVVHLELGTEEGRGWSHDQVDYRELVRMTSEAIDGLSIGQQAGLHFRVFVSQADLRSDEYWGGHMHLRSRFPDQRNAACGHAGSADQTDILAYVTCAHCRASGEYEKRDTILYGSSWDA
jgi:hypothetical protein